MEISDACISTDSLQKSVPLSISSTPRHPFSQIINAKMRSLASIAALSTLVVASTTSAFMAPLRTAVSSRAYSSSSNDECTTVCDIPGDFVDTPTLSNATPIRSAVVTNYEGDLVRIDNAIKGSNPYVVIYLRHMG
jgi:hypothetical protein